MSISPINYVFSKNGIRIIPAEISHPEFYEAWLVLYPDGSISVHFNNASAKKEFELNIDTLIQRIAWDNIKYSLSSDEIQ